MTELHRATLISIKDSTELSEHWLQGALQADPSLLGLGDLTVRDVERRQPGAGRLDLLLADPESATRYEVEIQLGATDETHIIRTIEYWDLERRRYPQYEHVAVLVAEDVTSRFLNVINLFNGFIPIVAIQLQALKVEGALTLVATRVVDQMSLATEEEDEDTSVDRGYWEKRRGYTTSLQILDALMELIRTVEPNLQPNYLKHSVGLASNHVSRNFITCKPRKQHVIAAFRIPRTPTLDEELESVGIDTMEYSQRSGRYRVRLTQQDIAAHREPLIDLVRRARDADPK